MRRRQRDEGPSLDPGDGGGGEGGQGRVFYFCIFAFLIFLHFCIEHFFRIVVFFAFLYFCKVGREERVEVVVASYSGEMEQLLRQVKKQPMFIREALSPPKWMSFFTFWKREQLLRQVESNQCS